MEVVEDNRYSTDYLDSDKQFDNQRRIGFNDGMKTEKVEIACPIGHLYRRVEGISLLKRRYWLPCGLASLGRGARRSKLSS